MGILLYQKLRICGGTLIVMLQAKKKYLPEKSLAIFKRFTGFYCTELCKHRKRQLSNLSGEKLSSLGIELMFCNECKSLETVQKIELNLF